MHIQEVFNAIFKNHHYEYLIVNKEMKVVEFSDRVVDYCDAALLGNESINLFTLIPEFYGLEGQLKEFFTCKRSLLEIPHVKKGNEYYVNITVQNGRIDQNDMLETLVILFENVTEFIQMHQASVQDRNEKELLLFEISDLNMNLEAKIKEEVDKNQRHQLLMLRQSRLAQMGEIINMIAHQWRQPLNNLALVVQGFALKYQRNKLNDATVEKFEANAKKQIMQMSQTIDDFRDFFKPAKEKEIFNLHQAIENATDLVRSVFERERITLAMSVDTNLYINGYIGEFGQAMINIINNAKDALIEHQEGDRYIKIYTTLGQNNTFSLIIEDNAKGIAQDIIEKIFDPYFSTKLDKNGTGIGLYMTKMIIEEHMDASIEVQNTALGARFILGFKTS